MMEETGRVVAVENEVLWIETIQKSACNSCQAKSACGQSVLSKLSDGKRHLMKIERSNSHDTYQVDDQVRLGLPEDAIVKSVLWVYLAPLFGLFLGALLLPEILQSSFAQASNGDGVAILGAILGFVLSLFGVRAYLRFSLKSCELHPLLLGKAEPSLAVDAASSPEIIHRAN